MKQYKDKELLTCAHCGESNPKPFLLSRDDGDIPMYECLGCQSQIPCYIWNTRSTPVIPDGHVVINASELFPTFDAVDRIIKHANEHLKAINLLGEIHMEGGDIEETIAKAQEHFLLFKNAEIDFSEMCAVLKATIITAQREKI